MIQVLKGLNVTNFNDWNHALVAMNWQGFETGQIKIYNAHLELFCAASFRTKLLDWLIDSLCC